MSDQGSAWAEMVSTALVGTARRPYQGELLEDAAVEVVRQRAGQTATNQQDGPGAQDGLSSRDGLGGRAEAEEQRVVAWGAAERLGRILGGEHGRVLAEWLAVAAAGGRRVPPHVLPELLERGRRDRSIRGWLGVLAGRRGRWLAERNPAWAFLLDEPTGESWEYGSPADRHAHLRAVRAADPAAALALLEATWERETPEDRAEFTETLAVGLSMADEPFLERALDDRRREVRQSAANLLAGLPDSRLAGRMARRAARCLEVSGGRVEVRPPEECDAAMERDGVRAKPPRGIGERAWWLQQVVARAPLRMWARPGVMLGLRFSDWDAEVKAGWVRAAVLQRDAGWARAMFAHDPIADLLGVLAPEEQQELAAEFVKNQDMDSQLIMVLGGVERPWRAGLAAAVLNKIARIAATQPWNLGELARLAGERVDPELHPLAERSGAGEVAEVLRFRAEMVAELREGEGA
ncbi:DUF5691 domain-containing protein [Nonomuraea sp. NPDC050790]|uniref:DUF5691 domain-containing protein n=1 Tax=Nonomuraea sp. NPDC050790 TaxID=3364371 RepID=UPI0037B4DB05